MNRKTNPIINSIIKGWTFSDGGKWCSKVFWTECSALNELRPWLPPSLCWASSGAAKAWDRVRGCSRNRCGTAYPTWSASNYPDGDRRRREGTWWHNSQLKKRIDGYVNIKGNQRMNEWMNATYHNFVYNCPWLQPLFRTVRSRMDGTFGKSSRCFLPYHWLLWQRHCQCTGRILDK